MTSVTVIVTSAFIELMFEAVVDALALDLEAKNGIDLDEFWQMWKVNPLAFWGLAVTDNMLARHVVQHQVAVGFNITKMERLLMSSVVECVVCTKNVSLKSMTA